MLRLAVFSVRVLSVLLLLANLFALLAEPSWYAGLLTCFGLLVVLVAFGFAFGQRVERRASRARRRRLLDTAVVWALAVCALALVGADSDRQQRLMWFAIAAAVLLIESLYRAMAARLERSR